jgi:hypothetical protein
MRVGTKVGETEGMNVGPGVGASVVDMLISIATAAKDLEKGPCPHISRTVKWDAGTQERTGH